MLLADGRAVAASSDDLVARLEALEGELARLRTRLDRLEGGALAGSPPPSPVAQAGPVPRGTEATGRPPDAPAGEGLVSLAGAMLLGLAGAYLVRALTDGGTLSAAAGVALGLSYAAAFLPLCARAASARRPLAASAHGLTAALIAYPLLWETTVRFALLRPPVALALLIAVATLALLVAARYALASVAWIHAGAALASCLGLLVVTRQLAAVTLALLALAALIESLAQRAPLAGLRWPAAAALDLAVLVLVWIAGRAQGVPEGYPPLSPALAVGLALGLPLLYLVCVATATLRSRRALAAFEVLQLAIAVTLGFQGAAHVLVARGLSTVPLGLSALALGLAAYAVAFAFVERQQGRGANFYVYSTGGALLLLVGSTQLLAPVPRVTLWAGLAVLAAALSQRFDRATLRYHALAYLGAASLASGLFTLAIGGLFAPGPVALPALAGVAWAASLATYAIVGQRDEGPLGRTAVPRLLAALVLVSAVPGGLAVTLAHPLGEGQALLMALRTAALATVSVALASGARSGRPELGWLAYGALAVGALKLAIQDLPAGHPAELFTSFLLLGGAVVLSSRLLASAR